jgi:hypothetical protein
MYDAALFTDAAANAEVAVDHRLEDGVATVVLAQRIPDGDCLVGERTGAITDLTANTFEGYAEVAIDQRGAHAHLVSALNRSERTRWACRDAGKITTETTSAPARGDIGCRLAKTPQLKIDDAIGAGLRAFSAFYALGKKVVLVCRTRRTQSDPAVCHAIKELNANQQTCCYHCYRVEDIGHKNHLRIRAPQLA